MVRIECDNTMMPNSIGFSIIDDTPESSRSEDNPDQRFTEYRSIDIDCSGQFSNYARLTELKFSRSSSCTTQPPYGL